MTDTTEPAVAPGEIQASADWAEFQEQYGFDRPHHFGPIFQMEGGGVKFSAGHERLPNWVFTVIPSQPDGFSLGVWSIGQNPLSKDDRGEQVFGLPVLQHIDLGVVHPTVAASIAAAKVYLGFLIQDLERTAWTAWQQFRASSAEDGVSGWN